MNLKDVMESLETINGVNIVLDLSTHAACDFDSNCPKAIKLRQLIAEAGVNMGQIIQGYGQLTTQIPPDRPISVDSLFPNTNGEGVDGRVQVTIAGQSQRFDFTEEIKRQLQQQLSSQLARIQETKLDIDIIANSLYFTYLQSIDRAKNTKTVEQIQFPIRDLLANKIISNKNELGSYDFFVPVTYNPQYLIDNGVRYAITDKDMVLIKRDNCFIRIELTKKKKFRQITLIKQDGTMLEHYHGIPGNDCWGNIRLPEKWDNTARQLQQIAHERIGALGTVNYNSILNHEPDGMPTDRKLRDRVKEIGKEGELRPTNDPPISFRLVDGVVEAMTPLQQVPLQPEPVTVPRRWGR